MEEQLTTADVPRQFLQSAFLVGHIPFRALASDPRISYASYIPPEHYNPNPKASEIPKKLSLLIFIHGTGRTLRPIYSELADFADATPCAVVAPLFPAAIDGPNDIGSYKLLKSKNLRSDLVMLSILDEIGHRWPGIETTKMFLMGFSGGGQFAHRFLYLYLERLSAISIGAPGIADTQNIFGRAVNKALVGRVCIQLIVGGNDVEVHGGGEFWKWVKKMKGAEEATQVVEQRRVQTLRDLHEAWKVDEINAAFTVVEGIAHEADKARATML